MLRQASQNGASDAPDAFAAATLAALIDAARGGPPPRHIRHPKVAWEMTSTRWQVGRFWRLRLHERRLTW